MCTFHYIPTSIDCLGFCRHGGSYAKDEYTPKGRVLLSVILPTTSHELAPVHQGKRVVRGNIVVHISIHSKKMGGAPRLVVILQLVNY